MSERSKCNYTGYNNMHPHQCNDCEKFFCQEHMMEHIIDHATMGD